MILRLVGRISQHHSLRLTIGAGLGALVLLSGVQSSAATKMELDQLLKKADEIKIVDQTQFKKTMLELGHEASSLTPAQQEYWHYLEGWQRAYDGQYEEAVSSLNAVLSSSQDATLKFRARATIVNVLSIAKHQEDALTNLSALLEALPAIKDVEAREQALAVAARVYNLVGQYDLGTTYADMLASENAANGGLCRGGQMKLEALTKSGKLTEVTQDFERVIDSCVQSGELLRANLVRTYIARIHIANRRPEAAVKILSDHYAEVQNAEYPNLISGYEAFLAQGYREIGDKQSARLFAQRAAEHSVKNEYTEPLVTAYRLLYLLAKEQGDTRAALAYHEKFTSADKGYLDDLSMRQLAYQRVKHEVDANKLQIVALNRQNDVLKLQQQLNDKVLENVRLYIILSTVVLGFIGFWAYKTKLSQLHFMKLSRLDGLTGVFNRPHFIEQSNRALQAARRTGQATCVVICDLDHFKSINDNWGHAAGDSVLKRTVSQVSALLRGGDLLGRLGGEEFGILLVDCDAAAARQRCELLRAALAEVSVTDERSEVKLSASFGIGCSAASGYEFRELLAHADAALYQAKRTGRDRVVVYDAHKFNETIAGATERLRA